MNRTDRHLHPVPAAVIIIGILLLCSSCTAATDITPVYAIRIYPEAYMSDSGLGYAQALQGTDTTMGEVLELVYPNIWSQVPSGNKAYYDNTPMDWARPDAIAYFPIIKSECPSCTQGGIVQGFTFDPSQFMSSTGYTTLCPLCDAASLGPGSPQRAIIYSVWVEPPEDSADPVYTKINALYNTDVTMADVLSSVHPDVWGQVPLAVQTCFNKTVVDWTRGDAGFFFPLTYSGCAAAVPGLSDLGNPSGSDHRLVILGPDETGNSRPVVRDCPYPGLLGIWHQGNITVLYLDPGQHFKTDNPDKAQVPLREHPPCSHTVKAGARFTGYSPLF
jgi:hypothetical protein